MPRFFLTAAALLLIIAAPGPARADLTGRTGIGVFGGAAHPVLDKRIREITATGGNFGFIVRRGFRPRWEGAFSVEHLNNPQVDVSAFLLSGIYAFQPAARWSPVARLGFGVARVHGVGSPTEMDDRLAFKPGAGFEGKLSPSYSLGVYTDFLWSVQASRDDKIIGVFNGGLLLTYFFGSGDGPAAKHAPEPPVADDGPAAD